jgi:hypothetical protein
MMMMSFIVLSETKPSSSHSLQRRRSNVMAPIAATPTIPTVTGERGGGGGLGGLGPRVKLGLGSRVLVLVFRV